MKAVICIPTVIRPYQQCLDALEAAIPAMDAAGIEHSIIFEVGNPYISAARATMLRKALDTQPECIVFIDHDVSFRPADLVRLILADGCVVGGTYRFKQDVEDYMGYWYDNDAGKPLLWPETNYLKSDFLPAGFLKLTVKAVDMFMKAYPELVYGAAFRPFVDIFNHGAIGGSWYGEDYAFSKRWVEKFGPMVLIQDLQIDHWSTDKCFSGNLHRWLLRQPGGINADGQEPQRSL